MTDRFNILYVDDEADNLFAFRSIFRRFFNVHTALDAKKAISVLDERPIHLVLSDQRMPGMSGVELCELISDRFPMTSRMIVTGYSEMQPIHDAMEAGYVHSYIMKPWNVDELKTHIDSALHTNIA